MTIDVKPVGGTGGGAQYTNFAAGAKTATNTGFSEGTYTGGSAMPLVVDIFGSFRDVSVSSVVTKTGVSAKDADGNALEYNHFVVFQIEANFTDAEFFPTNFEWVDQVNTFNAHTVTPDNGWYRTNDGTYTTWAKRTPGVTDTADPTLPWYVGGQDYSIRIQTGHRHDGAAVTYTKIDFWLDELIASMSQVSVAAAKQALRAAFREFCIDSEAWQRDAPYDLSVINGQREVPLFPYSGGTIPAVVEPDGTILRIKKVDLYSHEPETYGTTEYSGIDAKFERTLTQLTELEGRRRALTNDFQYFYTMGEDTNTRIILCNVPVLPQPADASPVPGNVGFAYGGQKHSSLLKAWVVMGFPENFDDNRIPLFFRTRHFDAILEGAKGRLHMQHGKPYTNLGLAQYYQTRFRNFIQRAHDEANRGHIDSNRPVPFPLVGVTRNNRGLYGS